MKENLRKLGKVLVPLLTAVVAFESLQVCMWLLNQKSTLANIAGLFTFATLGTLVGIYIMNKFKQD